jgi:hypothetical protein
MQFAIPLQAKKSASEEAPLLLFVFGSANEQADVNYFFHYSA